MRSRLSNLRHTFRETRRPSCQRKLLKNVSNVTRSCFYQIRQLKHIRRYLHFQSTATAVHSFVTSRSRVDYSNGLLAAAPVKQLDQLRRVLNASCSTLRLQSTRESQRSASLAAYARASDIQDYVPRCTSACTEWPPVTSTSCAFQCALTPFEVISDRRTKRS